MVWLLNEVSLKNHFSSRDEFEAFFSTCLSLKNKLQNHEFLISQNIGQLENILHGKRFFEVLQSVNRDLKQQLLRWVDKTGPFWDKPATETEDDYFEFDGEDVTDYALGEAARKQVEGESHSHVFSADSDRFASSLLTVVHGIQEDIQGKYQIPNTCEAQEVLDLHRSEHLPSNWRETLECFQERFSDHLVFSPALIKAIEPVPFSIALFNSLIDRFTVLKEIVNAREGGRHSAKSKEIIKQHFQGDKAWFSDESATNKADFANELQFINSATGERETYTFHGKVNGSSKLRFYFDWPMKPEQTRIQIVYLGPKITKR